MREPARARSNEEEADRGSPVAWFLAGAVAGVVIGILFAPRSGRATRDTITETSRDWYGRTREFYQKGLLAVDDAAELFERGRRMASGGMD